MNEGYLESFRDFIIRWRIIQKFPVGGTLILVKDDLDETILKVMQDYLSDYQKEKDCYHWSGIEIKLISKNNLL